MSREILFRGMTKTGKFVYGSFIKNKIDCPFIVDIEAYQHEVIPSTVGQYTELKDKNGTKIFDGDILEKYHFKDRQGKIHTMKKVVMWCNDLSAWTFSHTENDILKPYNYLRTILKDNDCEVIGSIHDKGKEK